MRLPRDLQLRVMVLVSILVSPMTLLYYGVEYMMGPPHLAGLIFLFGELHPYSSRAWHDPLDTLNPEAFLLLTFVWVSTGAYLVLSTPRRLDMKLTIAGNLLALAAQISTPFLLFYEYLLVIPVPTPAVIALVAVAISSMVSEQRMS